MSKFLKLTKWKIIIALILTAIFESFVYWVGLHAVLCKMCPPPPTYCPPCVSPETGIMMAGIALVPALLIIYLLVCLGFYIYKKIKE